MTLARRSTVCAVAAACSGAFGQGQFSQGSVLYSFDFAEYDTTTYLPVLSPNGFLEPGESAMIRLTMSYAPAHGSPVTFPTSLLLGSSGSGVIGGFWFGILNLNGTGGAEGSWSVFGGSGPHRRGQLPPFATGGTFGIPNSSGTIIENISPAQFAASVTTLSTITGVHVWRGLWTPGSYSPRVVTFAGGPASLPGPSASTWVIDDTYTVTGFDLPVVGIVPWEFGQVQIPIVPAPATAAAIGGGAAAGAIAGRRRGEQRSRS